MKFDNLLFKNGARVDGRRAVLMAVLFAAVAGGAWGGYAVWNHYEESQTPSCSWPVRIEGAATAPQAGLVRCYLRALAARDISGLIAVAQNIPPVRITGADFKYSSDAHAGLATAIFTPSPVDDTFVLLTITYADGVSEKTGIENMVSMGGDNTWRMAIGTEPSSPSDAPATAKPT